MTTIRPGRSSSSYSSDSGSSTNISGPLSGFGELSVISPYPTSQISFVYDINPLLIETNTYGAGASVTLIDGEINLSNGSGTDSYARVSSKKVAKYRPGQSTLARWTARYSLGTANNRQMAGIYNIEGGYRFGYDGEDFGILYTKSATIEVQALTITTKSSSATTVSVSLGGAPAIVVSVTNSANTFVTAYEISRGDYSQVAGGWNAIAIQNVVYFVRKIAGSAGSSSFNPGSSGAIGSFSTITTGVLPVEYFIPQTSWNVDTCNGSGNSRINIDTEKGNIYQVQFQYLGYGNAYFSIVNSEDGRSTLCHVIKNANTISSTNLRNPNLYLSWENINTGISGVTTLRGASGGTYVEGTPVSLGPQFSVTTNKSIPSSAETVILSLRASTIFHSRKSTVQVQLERISISCEGPKPVEYKVYKNINLIAAQFQSVNINTSSADYDQSASSFSIGSGAQIFGFTTSKSGNITEDVSNLNIFLQPGDVVTVTANTTGSGSDISISMVWKEDI